MVNVVFQFTYIEINLLKIFMIRYIFLIHNFFYTKFFRMYSFAKNIFSLIIEDNEIFHYNIYILIILKVNNI